MNQVVQDALCRQITSEFSASYAYLSMSTYCERNNFLGSARWLRVQSQEEYAHAMKLIDFLLARNLKVGLQAIPAPQVDFESLVDVFEKALAQEQEVSKQIDGLYELAFKEKAFAALVELQWFLTEQVEEERVAREIVAKIHMVKHDPAALLELDRELGARTGDAKATVEPSS
jgi:ferritin